MEYDAYNRLIVRMNYLKSLSELLEFIIPQCESINFKINKKKIKK